MSNIVISVENLSKSYKLGQIGTGTFSRDLEMWWAKTRGKPNPLLKIGETDHDNQGGDTLWALKDINFTVQQGEVLGIIGRNGAGKSTLLKILSRVTAPTSGQVKVKGRIASLLEVGTGFHPELTGSDNIYLNGAILGMNRQEVQRKFDEIVAFAEVEKFIDTPVKRYSSGMYVRLAFAVAAHLESEILLVDEVLAVGDAEFQKKCLGKMGDVANQGRTVLFVSHNMGAVSILTHTAIVLANGSATYYDSTDMAISNYINSQKNKSDYYNIDSSSRKICDDPKIQFKQLHLIYDSSHIYDSKKPLKFGFKIMGNEDVRDFRVSMTIFKVDGTPVGTFIGMNNMKIKANEVSTYRIIFKDHRLTPGLYYCGISVGVGSPSTRYRDFDTILNTLFFEVEAPMGENGTLSHWRSVWGAINFPTPLIRKEDFGIKDLD